MLHALRLAVLWASCACAVAMHGRGGEDKASLAGYDTDVYKLLTASPMEQDTAESKIKTAGRLDAKEAAQKRKALLSKGERHYKRGALKRNLKGMEAEERVRESDQKERTAKHHLNRYGMSDNRARQLRRENLSDLQRAAFGSVENVVSNLVGDHAVKDRKAKRASITGGFERKEKQKIAKENRWDPAGAGGREKSGKKAAKFMKTLVKENKQKKSWGLPHLRRVDLGRMETEDKTDASKAVEEGKVPKPDHELAHDDLLKRIHQAHNDAAALHARAEFARQKGRQYEALASGKSDDSGADANLYKTTTTKGEDSGDSIRIKADMGVREAKDALLNALDSNDQQPGFEGIDSTGNDGEMSEDEEVKLPQDEP